MSVLSDKKQLLETRLADINAEIVDAAEKQSFFSQKLYAAEKQRDKIEHYLEIIDEMLGI
jgi:hypothetical protein